MSAIHENDELANVHKMKYFKGYLEELVRSVISGVPITDSNYQTAIELLKKRLAKPSRLEHSNINQMVNIQPVSMKMTSSGLGNSGIKSRRIFVDGRLCLSIKEPTPILWCLCWWRSCQSS